MTPQSPCICGTRLIELLAPRSLVQSMAGLPLVGGAGSALHASSTPLADLRIADERVPILSVNAGWANLPPLDPGQQAARHGQAAGESLAAARARGLSRCRRVHHGFVAATERAPIAQHRSKRPAPAKSWLSRAIRSFGIQGRQGDSGASSIPARLQNTNRQRTARRAEEGSPATPMVIWSDKCGAARSHRRHRI